MFGGALGRETGATPSCTNEGESEKLAGLWLGALRGGSLQARIKLPQFDLCSAAANASAEAAERENWRLQWVTWRCMQYCNNSKLEDISGACIKVFMVHRQDCLVQGL